MRVRAPTAWPPIAPTCACAWPPSFVFCSAPPRLPCSALAGLSAGEHSTPQHPGSRCTCETPHVTTGRPGAGLEPAHPTKEYINTNNRIRAGNSAVSATPHPRIPVCFRGLLRIRTAHQFSVESRLSRGQWWRNAIRKPCFSLTWASYNCAFQHIRN